MTLDLPGPPEHGTAPQYPIESVDNALRVLLLLRHRESVRLTEVSQHLGVASSTAHRLLAMLQFRGFVDKDPAGRGYVPGPTLDALAIALLRRHDVRTRARPVLEKLHAQLDETVHLGRLEGNEVHFIDSIESSRALRVGGRVGRRAPAHCTSNGKAMLATLTDAQVRELYPEESLPKLTPASIGTLTELLEELHRVRRQGYATSEGESEDGVASVAVALPSSATPLAVNASLPVMRMSRQTRATTLGSVRAAVAEIADLVL